MWPYRLHPSRRFPDALTLASQVDGGCAGYHGQVQVRMDKQRHFALSAALHTDSMRPLCQRRCASQYMGIVDRSTRHIPLRPRQAEGDVIEVRLTD